jgi:small subunit ribosomal protein S9
MAETAINKFNTGRRKSATARVRLLGGTGKVTVNKRALDDYFKAETLRAIILQPLALAKMQDKLDVQATVAGGGISGQAGAIRLGIARALVKQDETLKKAMRGQGFLTRDPRAKERKKYGQKRARKRFQYTKR